MPFVTVRVASLSNELELSEPPSTVTLFAGAEYITSDPVEKLPESNRASGFHPACSG
jgi:hypothetical protein